MVDVMREGGWPAHPEEAARLRCLDAFRQVEAGIAPPELTSLLDSLTQLGAAHFCVPICLITLIDEHTQHHIGAHGLPARSVPRAASFCAHALAAEGGVFSVPDAQSDPRFWSNSLVVGDPHIRFYAGAPLVHRSSGQRLGMLCIISDEPRQLGTAEIAPLQAAAAVVMTYLEEYIYSSRPCSFRVAMPCWLAPDAVLAHFSAQLRFEASQPGEAAAVDAVEVAPQSSTVPATAGGEEGGGGGPPIARLVARCLGWSGVTITAERLVAALRDACLHLEAPPVSCDLASPSPIDIRPTSRWSFDAQTTASDDTSSVLVIISIWRAAAGTHDIHARRARGDVWTYHQFLRDLQAELYERLPEVPEGALVLSRAGPKVP